MKFKKVKKRKVSPRTVVLFCILVGIMGIFAARMFDFQVVTAAKYASVSGDTRTIQKTVKAARGEILDRYGRPLVVNRNGYDVIFNYAEINMDKINDTIVDLTDLFAESGTEWIDLLPLTDTFPIDFDGEKSDIAAMKSKLGLNTYATARNCYDEMVRKYSLEGMNKDLQRRVMGVRYSMDKSDFSIFTSYTFAKDISKQLLTYIEESYSYLDGVSVDTVPYREYASPDIAPHIIGVMSKITAEDWEKYRDKGYSYNDTVGAFGMEKTFEDYLHGEDGIISYKVNNDGKIISSEVTKEPVQGDTVYSSIDKNLQRVAQNALKNTVEESKATMPEIAGASAVVVEVKTGQVLAAANYPSYSLDTYYDDIETLQKDKTGKPLNNRAFSGIYPPGSCYKPLVAAVGLQTGAITPSEHINCVRKYTYYDSNGPSCMGHHGNINVVSALSKSCNYYFFETGRRIGIDKIDQYAKLFGLGTKTGDPNEIDESSGRLAGPEFSAKMGATWYAGNTLQAAIGQGDNAFTPLQLAAYTATIANNGTRYQTTILNSIKSYDLSEMKVNRNTPKTVAEVGISAENMNIVKEGMLSVTEDGTARRYFSDYPVKVAGKTGTAENAGKDHSVFVCFAPYDDPEIAISVVVEHGQYSTTTGPVAKAILDEYFFNSTTGNSDSQVNTLLR